MDVGKLKADLILRTDGFKRGIQTATKGFRSLGKSAMYLNQSIELIQKGWRGLTNVAQKTAGSFIQAADTSDKYRITLDSLLGSQKESNRLFTEMSKFAGSVPFEYEKIMDSAVQLAGVMDGGVDEIQQWMPMIADLAAVSRLSVEETTGQIVRMYSAGAASADLFREKGITAMLGFTAGAKTTAKETRRRLMEAFNDPLSKFRGASNELAKTWTGMLSMISDRWFIFRNKVMDSKAFDALKGSLRDLLDYIDQLVDSGKMDEWAEFIGEKFGEIVEEVRNYIKTDFPKHLETAKKAAEYAAIALVKMAKGIEALVHLGDALANSAKGYKAWQDGHISFAEYATSDYGELKAILDDLDSNPALFDKRKEAEKLSERIHFIAEQMKITQNALFDWGKEDAMKQWTGKLVEARGELARVLEEIERLKNKNKELNDTWVDPLAAGENTALPGMSGGDAVVKRQKVLSKEATMALEQLKKKVAEVKFDKKQLGMTDLEKELAKVNYEADKLAEKFKGEFSESPEIEKMIEQIRRIGTENAKAADKIAWDEKIKEATESLQSQIKQISFEGQTFGLNEMQAGLKANELAVAELKDEYAELIAKSPELEDLINQIGALKNKNLEAAQTANLKERLKEDQAQFDSEMFGSAFGNEYLQGLYDINAEYERMIENGYEIGGLADTWREQKLAMLEYSQTAASVRGVMQGMTSTIADLAETFMATGKINLKGLVEGLAKSLQAFAAQKTAHLLMEAAYQGVMALIAWASQDMEKMAKHQAAAAAALSAAPIMASFVAGAGLSGIAHAGINEIPEDGTWLLKKGERVTDPETNKDLKEFLKNEGGKSEAPQVNVQFYNSDEASVTKALPQLKQTIIEAVTGDIASNGPIRQTMKQYD